MARRRIELIRGSASLETGALAGEQKIALIGSWWYFLGGQLHKLRYIVIIRGSQGDEMR